MVGVFLLIHVDEARYCASVRLSASRGVNTLMFGVVPEVVDTGDTLKPSKLLARLRVQDNQQRRGPTATEKPMIGLIQRQRRNKRNRHRPGCDFLPLFSITPSHPLGSGKTYE